MGSRFGGPKQLEPLGPNGETLLDYSIYDARGSGFDRVVLIIRREMQDAFEATIAAHWRRHLPVEYVYQELDDVPAGFSVPPARRKPWGTGQALLAAVDVVNEPFAVLNADDFYGPGAFSELHAFLSKGATSRSPSYANVGFALQDTMTEAGSVNRAVLQVSEGGRLEGLSEVLGIEQVGRNGRYRTEDGEVRTIPGSTLVSMNMWGFTSTIFEQLDEGFHSFLEERGGEEKSEYLLPDRVEELIRNGLASVEVLQGAGPWCGITYPEDILRVKQVLHQLVERGTYPRELWA